MDYRLFATVPKGMESLLAGELRALGGHSLRQLPAGVSFTGSLESAYRACLWSRLGSRILLEVATGRAGDADQLYATVQGVHWDEHLDVDGTFAVAFTGVSDTLRDTRFGALRVKDAIVDQFRAGHDGRRPSVDVEAPDIRVNVHLARGRVTVAIDLSGDSLHRRGYRSDRVQVEAPIKENLAAAVLLFAGWPREAATEHSFLDPLCGSGTLAIEAAWIAADIAPALLRADRGIPFGFNGWKGHDDVVWQRLLTEARRRRNDGLHRLREVAAPPIRGADRDNQALRVAQDCAAHAGLADVVALERAELAELTAPGAQGLLATNVPYGERLGQRRDATETCRLLGRRLRACFAGWHAAVLAGEPDQLAVLGLTAEREIELYNGALRCSLGYYAIDGASAAAVPRSARAEARSSKGVPAPEVEDLGQASGGPEGEREAPSSRAASAPRLLSGNAEQLANRLRKNQRRLARHLRREDISCYRLYDADLPEYNLVVDVYGDFVHVQEYAAPAEIEESKTQRRLDEALAVIAAVLETPADHLVLKRRQRQRGSAQYDRQAALSRFQPVVEDGLTYLVNLTDYLDTGLFLDQRLTRRLIRTLAGGRRFLNLFAYTGTMTVNALAGGSPSSTSVDLSATYLEWAQRNLVANGLAATLTVSEGGAGSDVRHQLIQADCLRWVANSSDQFDLIWLDPPTFSNSKRMGRATFDVQRDHTDLIRLCARRLLTKSGTMLFATNRRGFRLDAASLGELHVEDLSRTTLPPDCERSANRHHVYRIEHRR